MKGANEVLRTLIVASLLLSTGPVEAQRRNHRPAPSVSSKQFDPNSPANYDWESGEDAGRAIRQCMSAPNQYHECSSSWRNFVFEVKEGHRIEVSEKIPNSDVIQRWSIYCSKDKMNDRVQCSAFFKTGAGGRTDLTIVKSYLSYAVVWGKDGAFDKSPLVRFDSNDAVPISEKAMWSSQVGDLMISKMRTSKRAIFRYHTWPERIPVDVEVNTSQFREFDAFYSASFSYMRELLDAGA